MRPVVTLFPLLAVAAAAPSPNLGDAASVPKRDVAPTSIFSQKRNWEFLNSFLAKIANIFPFNEAVGTVSDLITTGEEILADYFDIDITENDFSGTSYCYDVTVLFARGTADPGNVGALVGPPFFDSLAGHLSSGQSLGIQGLEYPASVEGFLNGSEAPGRDMAKQVKTILQACPNTKLVMSGYSQGGAVTHNAAEDLGSKWMSRVSSVVIFGDPDSHESVQGIDQDRVLIICHDGDNICQQGDIILLPHLTYAVDADTAAGFVVSHL